MTCMATHFASFIHRDPCVLRHAMLYTPLQKTKKAERKKRDKEDAKAEELGLEPPPRKQQRVCGRASRGWCCPWITSSPNTTASCPLLHAPLLIAQ